MTGPLDESVEDPHEPAAEREGLELPDTRGRQIGEPLDDVVELVAVLR
jgi:hypothetical protein